MLSEAGQFVSGALIGLGDALRGLTQAQTRTIPHIPSLNITHCGPVGGEAPGKPVVSANKAATPPTAAPSAATPTPQEPAITQEQIDMLLAKIAEYEELLDKERVWWCGDVHDLTCVRARRQRKQ